MLASAKKRPGRDQDGEIRQKRKDTKVETLDQLLKKK